MKRGIDYVGIGVVTICHDGQGNYLLGLRSDKCRDEHGRWDPTGSGGLEFGELLEDALKREIKEECGADVIKVEFLGNREVFRNQENIDSHYITFDYRVEIKREQVVNTEPDKCLELRWCQIGKFPEPLHSQFPFFLEKYKDKL